MASLHRRKGGWQVRYGPRVNGRDARKLITIGEMSRSEAVAAKLHIEHLHECQRLSAVPSIRTRRWLESLELKVHNRIAKKGLCEYRCDEQTKTVGGLCKHFLDWKNKDMASSSIEVYQKSIRMLTHYFGDGRDITTILPAEMDDFFRWVYKKGRLVGTEYKRPLAPTTASRRCQNVQSIFHRAERQQWIDSVAYHAMFDRMPRQTRMNPDRQHWVDAETVQHVIDKGAMNNEQRLIFALGRWGGIRMPSELIQIRWSDVDRETEKIRVTAPKQRSNPHRIERWIPLWPEIRRYLDIAFDEAPPREEFIIVSHRSKHTSAHAGLFLAACFRANVTKSRRDRPWPKLWTNMRSTRATELRKEYAPDVVDYWMNHSAKVSKDHYQQWDNFDWRQ